MSAQNHSLLTLAVALTGTVVADRFVTLAGLQTGAAGDALGVALSPGVSGDRIPVDVLGTAVVEAGAAIAVDAFVQSDASGRAIALVPTTVAHLLALRGRALQAAGAAGEKIEVLLSN